MEAANPTPGASLIETGLLEAIWSAGRELFDRAPDAAAPWLAAIVSAVCVLIVGGPCIRWLARRLYSPVRGDSPTLAKLHAHKSRTPSMGGLFLTPAVMISAALWIDLSNPSTLALLGLIAGFALLGAVDDLAKLSTRGQGLSSRVKWWAQVALTLSAACIWRGHQDLDWSFVPWAVLVVVGASNGVNLTDGLDGLAAGCLTTSSAALLVVLGLFYFPSHPELASGASADAAVLLGGLLGASTAFLWFNRAPAKVFMGDVGALPLGALLGAGALLCRVEWLLVVVGGVFVAETLSVAAQVLWFKRTGRRLFRCAPLHHHFQFAGWAETVVVRRFWWASAAFALAGLFVAAGLYVPAKIEPHAAPALADRRESAVLENVRHPRSQSMDLGTVRP